MIWLSALRLKSANPEIRQRAIEKLAGSTRSQDTDRIFASLYDENPRVRCAAVRALEKANKADTVPSLVGALKDENYEVRETAARALGRLGDVSALPALRVCLKDFDSAVRTAAAAALRALGWKPSTTEELARFEIALGKTNPSSSSRTTSAESTGPGQDTTFHRRAAAEAWKEINDPARIKTLIASLQESGPGKRLAALHDLAQITDELVTVEMAALFRDQDRDVRLNAAQLVASRNDASPAGFVGLLADDCPEIRLIAVQFLGKIRYPHVAELLVPLLTDQSNLVRIETATALGRLGNPCALESLIMALVDEDPRARQTSEIALNQIDRSWPRSASAEVARWRLQSLHEIQSSDALRAAIERVIQLIPDAGSAVADLA